MVFLTKSTYKGYTDARKRANAKYKENKLETIQIYLKKGQKERIKEAAKQQGISVNQFIINAIDNNMVNIS